jgi:hypothetical protein
MPQYQAMQKFVLGDVWDFNPLPPAPAAAIAKPEKLVDLAAAFMRAYSERKRRIA